MRGHILAKAFIHKFEVDEKRERKWRKQKQQLESLPRRLNRRGCKAALPDMEELVAWIDDLTAEN